MIDQLILWSLWQNEEIHTYQFLTSDIIEIRLGVVITITI